MKITKCQWCGGTMIIKPRELDENDIYLQECYHAKFTDKYFHEQCFFEFMRLKYNIVNPDEL